MIIGTMRVMNPAAANHCSQSFSSGSEVRSPGKTKENGSAVTLAVVNWFHPDDTLSCPTR